MRFCPSNITRPENLGLARQQLRHRARQHGLAGAGFADNAERATRPPATGRRDRRRAGCRAGSAARPTRPRSRARAGRGCWVRGPVAALHGHHSAAWRGSVMARSVSPTTLKASTVRNMARGRQKGDARRDLQALASLTDHAAPARRRRRHTEAEEAQRALDDDRHGDGEQKEGQAVGRTTLGSSSRTRMRGSVAPIARAARMNSRCAMLRVAARATRVKAGMLRMPMM